MRSTATIITMFLLALSSMYAGGPLGATGSTPRRYAASAFPLVYRTDQGPLGAFSNATATSIANYSFLQWDNVSSAAISFTNGGALPRDVTSATDAFISGGTQFSDRVNPIVFDNDGSIIDGKLGVGARNSVLGIAGSAYGGAGYVEGYAIINGVLSGAGGAADQDKYRATITHEIGHFLGLGHSQVAMHADFATMYPIIMKTAQQTLDPDDTAAIANLYPAATYAARIGGISGTVKRENGTNLSGVNVVAVNTVTGATYSTVVDYFSGGKQGFNTPPAATGSYTISGLPPGSYYVRIEPVNANFTGGSSVGSYDTPINTSIAREWYNGGSESGGMLADDQNQQTAVTVNAGSTTTGVNLIENDSPSLTTLLYHDGATAVAFSIPQGSITRYATRFTAPMNGSLVNIKFRLQGNSNLPLNGTMTASVYTNTAGSIAGIPGTLLGSVTVPFRDLAADQNNEIYLRGIGAPVNFNAGTNFHVVVTTNNVGSPVLLGDDGNPTQNRSSFFTSAAGWKNFGDGGIATGYNLIVWGLFSSQPIDAPLPKIAVSPTSLSFGTIRPGATVERTLSITNPGNAPLQVTGTPILGQDSLDYIVVSGGGAFTLAAGGSRNLVVRFAPRTAGSFEDGSKSARLSIMNNSDQSPYNIPLLGNAVQPLATRLDTAINFAGVLVGGTYVIDTTIIRNTCNDTLHISSVSITGPDAGAFRLLRATVPAAVPPGGTYSVRVQFTPTERRLYSATLRVLHDDSTGSSSFALLGNGLSAGVALSAITMQGGGVRVGESLNLQPLEIRNPGNAPLRITSVAISGANASDFTLTGPAITPASPLIIQPGGSAQLPLRFTPSEVGTRTATLEIVADGVPRSEVLLTGTGLQGVLSLTQGSVDFGDVQIGTAEERIIAATNSGNDTVIVAAPIVTGAGFSLVDPPTAGTRIAPNASLPLRIRFAPQSAGASTGMVTIVNNSVEPVVTMSLAGRGVQAGLALNRSSIAFDVVAPGESRLDSFIIRNTGTAPLTVTRLEITGGDAAAFQIVATPVPFTIEAGEADTVMVRLNPQSLERSFQAVLMVEGDGLTGQVALSATIGQALVASAPAISFGVRNNNGRYDTTIVVRNVSATDMMINTIEVTSTKDGVPGDYFSALTTLPLALRAGDSVDLLIRFEPTAGIGQYAGRVRLATNSSIDSMLEITLNGTVTQLTDVESGTIAQGPLSITLLPIAPNPVRDEVEIGYRTTGEGRVGVTILLTDMHGSLLSVLHDGIAFGDERGSGWRTRFDASSLPSGSYHVVLRSGEKMASRRMVIVR